LSCSPSFDTDDAILSTAMARDTRQVDCEGKDDQVRLGIALTSKCSHLHPG
jgi:hypothetical protein